MFDATDTMVAALLDKLSGTHLLFGGLVIETEPPGAVVTVNGMEVGPMPAFPARPASGDGKHFRTRSEL